MINSGRLTKKITIQKVTETKTGSGATTESWSDYIKTFASVEPLNGREFFAAQAVQAEESVKFRIRYQSGINTKMRIFYNDRIFDIQSVINTAERNDELILMSVEHID